MKMINNCEYFLQSKILIILPFSNALLLSKFKYNESLIDSHLFEKKKLTLKFEVIDDKIFQY